MNDTAARHRRRAPRWWLSLLSSVFAWPGAAQLPITVGPGCQHGSIQAAVDQAQARPGEDEIHLANTLTHAAQAIVIGSQDLTIRGGYPTCTSEPNGARTVVSGAGGQARSVFRIEGTGVKRLENLEITGGDVAPDNYGGGIYYAGTGELVLKNTRVSGNSAGYGAGIAVLSSGGRATLTLEAGTDLHDNTAQRNGGGLHLRRDAIVRLNAAGVTIHGNRASGTNGVSFGEGGGIYATDDAVVEIGSWGATIALQDYGVLDSNEALYGGGMALVASDEGAPRAQLYTTDAARAVRVRGNRALRRGGAFYLESYASTSSGGSPSLRVANFLVDENRAPDGAVLYTQRDVDGVGVSEQAPFAAFADTTSPVIPGSVPCTAGPRCRAIRANVATDGPLFYVDQEATLTLERTRLDGNEGEQLVLLQTDDSRAVATLRNALVTHNAVTGALFDFRGTGTRATIEASTIAANAIGHTHVLRIPGDADLAVLRNTIVFEPGKRTIETSNRQILVTAFNICSDVSTLAIDDATSLNDFPYFSDAEGSPPSFADKDFSLRAYSRGIDGAPRLEGASGATDINGAPRGKDLASRPNRGGPDDIGAFERQSLGDLLMNGGFDANLRFWDLTPASQPYAGFMTRALADVDGSPSSGSLEINIPTPNVPVGGQLVARTQCVLMPGPARYRLAARAYASGNVQFRDSPTVRWTVRQPSDIPCGGAVVGHGEMAFRFGLFGGWGQPFDGAAVVDVPSAGAGVAGEMTVEVALVATANGNDGPFDSLMVRFDALKLYPEIDESNTVPQARDDALVVAVGASTSVLAGGSDSLLDNDSDPDDDALAVTPAALIPPLHGAVTLQADGRFSYTHDGSASSSDAFEYEICDGKPGGCDVAKVSVSIGDGVFKDGFE